jgi:colicin import membrane protein
MTSAHPEPGRFASGVLAVAVHLVLVVLLVFGVRWQQKPPAPVVVDLWQEIPPVKPEPIAKPAPEPPPPPPAPKPEVQPPPEPPKPAPVVKAPPPEQPSRAEIELKEKQRKLREQKLEEQERRKEELRKKEEERRQKEAERREEQLRQEELKRQEAARRKEEEKRQEEALREEERRMEQEAEKRRAAIIEEQQKLAQVAKVRAEEDARKRAIAEAAAAKQRQLAQFMERIKQKVRGKVVLPPGMSANPEAVYSVTLLPGGEVLEVRLIKSSGVPAYDAAVERAIHAADPLPVPSDPDLFQQLRQANYKFRPVE